MKNWVNSIFNSSHSSADEQAADTDNILALKSELQEARLEQVAQEQAVDRLTHDLEMLRAREAERVSEDVARQIETIFRDAAGPAAQLAAQAYVLEQLQKPLQARDVLLVARRLSRALEKHGLILQGRPGEEVPYDPNLHVPMSSEQVLNPGQRAIVRIPGASYQDRLLVRAMVESKEGAE